VALAAGIFVLSSLPGGVLKIPPVDYLDKLVHLGIYFLLALLLLRALARTTRLAGWPRARVALALVAGLGVTDEVHQAFVPGRMPDAMDVAADAAGALLACAVFWLGSRRARRARPGSQPRPG
jgi:VanZ family protein